MELPANSSKMGTDFLQVAIASDGYPSDIAKLLQSGSSLRCQTKISNSWFHLFNNKRVTSWCWCLGLKKGWLDRLKGEDVSILIFFFYVFLLHPKKIQVEIQINFFVLLMWNIRIGLCNLQTNGWFDLGDVSATKRNNFFHHFFLAFLCKPIYHLHLPFNTFLFQFPLWNLSSKWSKWSPTARDAIVDQRHCFLASNGSSYLALSSVSRTYPSLPTGRILRQRHDGIFAFQMAVDVREIPPVREVGDQKEV